MKYIKLIKGLFVINFSRVLAYKAHFVAEMFTSLSWGLFSIISILLLTSKFSMIFGWTRPELILLIAMVNIMYGAIRVLFDINFWQFSRIIHRGDLDAVLLKPVDSQFQMSVWWIDLSAIVRVFIAFCLVIYLLLAFHMSISLVSVILGGILAIFGITLLYSLMYIFLTFTIWFSNLSNLMGLVNNVTDASRYPKEMYAGLNPFLFFLLLPILLIIATPTRVLIEKGNLNDSLLLILFAVVFFMISRLFWKFALRFYTSASG